MLIALFLVADEFKVTSWNIRNISMNKIGDRDVETLRKFYNQRKDFDVHLIQELRDKYAINMLSIDFRAVTSKKAKGRGKHKEFYGFLVNKRYKKVKLFDSRSYRKFQRPPTAVILDDKFAVISTHIYHGGNDSKTSIGKRKREVKALKYVRKQIHKKYKIPYSHIFIAGDFNLDSKQISESLKDKNSLVWIDEPTTVGRKKRFGNSYDHFITDSSVKGSSAVVKDIIKGRQAKSFIKRVSDHLPVEATFTVK
jgi:exonuclease III